MKALEVVTKTKRQNIKLIQCKRLTWCKHATVEGAGIQHTDLEVLKLALQSCKTAIRIFFRLNMFQMIF